MQARTLQIHCVFASWSASGQSSGIGRLIVAVAGVGMTLVPYGTDSQFPSHPILAVSTVILPSPVSSGLEH